MSMLDPLPENPYLTLGVPKDATANDVKKAYRKLVLTCHPDKTGSLPASMKKEKDEQFHRVQQAHDLLTNSEERRCYDDRVRLEELRSELRRDLGKDGMPPSMFKSGSYPNYSRSAPKTPSKSPTNPIFESARGPPIYETRVPKGVYDEDVYGVRRSSSRKHDERFEPPSTPRRSMSGRGPERMPDDIKKPERKEDDEEYYARKAREKASKEQQRTAQEERKKARSKMRRNDGSSKRHAFVDSDSEESEVERFMGSPRTTEFRRRAEEPAATKSKSHSAARRNPSASLSDSETDMRFQSALEHMRKTGSRFEGLDKRAAAKKKATPAVPPPPPPPPSKPPVTETRRPLNRRSASTSQSKPKRNLDIVEPSKEYRDDHTRDLPRRSKKEDSGSHSVPSSPRNLPKSARAQTFEPERSNDRPGMMRRTQTMPVNGRPSRSSNLKYSKLQKSEEEDEEEEETSGRSSEEKPTAAKYTTKKYRVNASDSDSDRKPRIVSVEPESPMPSPSMATATATATRSRARREESPRMRSHRAEMRSPPRRSNTMDNLASHNSTSGSSRPRHHHSSSGEGKLLFMEVPPDVSFAPRIGRDDIRYAEQRRSSTDGTLPFRERKDERKDDRSSKDDRKEHRRGKDDYYHARRGDHSTGLSRGTASYTSVHV